MSARDREGLIARIRQVRRATDGTKTQPAAEANLDRNQLPALERRVSHLERLVEGLQDSVHRESERQSKLVAELEARMQPAALGVALSRNARERGL